MSQRPRHGYAADLPRGPPARDENNAHPKSSRHVIIGGTRRARPTSPRFEPVASCEGRNNAGSSYGLPLVKVKLRPAALTARPWP